MSGTEQRQEEKVTLIGRLSLIITHVSLCWLTGYDGYASSWHSNGLVERAFSVFFAGTDPSRPHKFKGDTEK